MTAAALTSENKALARTGTNPFGFLTQSGKEMRVSQTANLGIVDSMHSENTYAHYLLDLGRLLKEEAMQARQQAKDAADDDKLFQEGRLLAYHEIVSLMQQQAIAFGLPLDSIGLQGINPDADLV